MDAPKMKRWQKNLIVFGTMCMGFAQGVAVYWGNMTVYIQSYMLMNFPSSTNTKAPWTIALFLIAKNGAYLMFDLFEKCVGRKWLPRLAILITNAGLVMSYFATHYSALCLTLSFGGVYGFGIGIVQGWALRRINMFANKEIGFLNALVYASGSIGSVLINEGVTLGLNPSNLSPNLRVGASTYFTQTEILDKVPLVFLYLGAFVLTTQIGGLCLVYVGEFFSLRSGNSEEESIRTVANVNNGSIYKSAEQTATNDTSLNGEPSEQSSPIDAIREMDEHALSANSVSSPVENDISEKTPNYSPRELLRNPTFYAIGVIILFSEIPFLLVFNYYKLFSQVYIHDDHFITLIGTSVAIGSLIGRIFWGAFMDKYGWKRTLSGVVFVLNFLLIWYFFTPMVDKWLFFVTHVIASNMISVFYASSIGVITLVFGRDYLIFKFGLLRSSVLIVNLIAPITFQAVIDTFGWFYAYSTIGTIGFISLIIIRIFMPNI